MAGKTVNFNTNCDLSDSQVEVFAKWLSCNGEVWGVGPTAVFASAAALFLYNELEATVIVVGDHLSVSMLEKTLVSTMVLGMLALMIHLWVCSMRFFQYYLDTLIRDSPNMLLEMTTAGLLGGVGQAEMVPLGPLTRFLRQQQPQIHITVCWFLSLCYADYVRKHYCTRFNMPYLELWQAELQERAARGAQRTMNQVHSFIGSVHRRLRGFGPETPRDYQTVLPQHRRDLSTKWNNLDWTVEARGAGEPRPVAAHKNHASKGKNICACGSSVSRARRLLMLLKSSEITSSRLDARVPVRETPASLVLPLPPIRTQTLEDLPWRKMAKLPFDT